MRLHAAGSGHAAVVVAPLPVDLPDPPAPAPEPDPEPVAAGDPGVAPQADTLVERIRTLTELYRAGMLDDEEFAAAKAVVLRDQAP